jgi:hypothetical protein
VASFIHRSMSRPLGSQGGGKRVGDGVGPFFRRVESRAILLGRLKGASLDLSDFSFSLFIITKSISNHNACLRLRRLRRW